MNHKRLCFAWIISYARTGKCITSLNKAQFSLTSINHLDSMTQEWTTKSYTEVLQGSFEKSWMLIYLI